MFLVDLDVNFSFQVCFQLREDLILSCNYVPNLNDRDSSSFDLYFSTPSFRGCRGRFKVVLLQRSWETGRMENACSPCIQLDIGLNVELFVLLLLPACLPVWLIFGGLRVCLKGRLECRPPLLLDFFFSTTTKVSPASLVCSRRSSLKLFGVFCLLVSRLLSLRNLRRRKYPIKKHTHFYLTITMDV